MSVQVVAAAKERGVTLETCLCTHRHFDHSGWSFSSFRRFVVLLRATLGINILCFVRGADAQQCVTLEPVD